MNCLGLFLNCLIFLDFFATYLCLCLMTQELSKPLQASSAFFFLNILEIKLVLWTCNYLLLFPSCLPNFPFILPRIGQGPTTQIFDTFLSTMWFLLQSCHRQNKHFDQRHISQHFYALRAMSYSADTSDEYKQGKAVPKAHTCKPSVQLGQEYRVPLTAGSCLHTLQL